MKNTLSIRLLLSLLVISSLSVVQSAQAAQAKVEKTTAKGIATKDQAYDYKQGDVALQGYLSVPATATAKQKKPAIIVVHDWMGMGDYVKKRTQMLAGLGYVAFAADIYGKDVHVSTSDEASKQATKYKSDRKLLRDRIRAAYDVVAGLPQVDAKKIIVIGYCFGGTTALELARSGADLKGTITFHGGLSTPHPEDAKNIKGKVLVLHGADDPYANTQERVAFEDEMRKGKVDWQMVVYGNTVHSFTLWDLPQDNSTGAAYNPESDKRSWAAMQTFIKEVLE